MVKQYYLFKAENFQSFQEQFVLRRRQYLWDRMQMPMSSSCFKQSPLVPKVSLVMFKLILSPSRFHSPSHSSGNSHSVKEINHLSVIFITQSLLLEFKLNRHHQKPKRILEFDLIDSIIFRIFIYLFLFLSGTVLSPEISA